MHVQARVSAPTISEHVKLAQLPLLRLVRIVAVRAFVALRKEKSLVMCLHAEDPEFSSRSLKEPCGLVTLKHLPSRKNLHTSFLKLPTGIDILPCLPPPRPPRRLLPPRPPLNGRLLKPWSGMPSEPCSSEWYAELSFGSGSLPPWCILALGFLDSDRNKGDVELTHWWDAVRYRRKKGKLVVVVVRRSPFYAAGLLHALRLCSRMMEHWTCIRKCDPLWLLAKILASHVVRGKVDFRDVTDVKMTELIFDLHAPSFGISFVTVKNRGEMKFWAPMTSSKGLRRRYRYQTQNECSTYLDQPLEYHLWPQMTRKIKFWAPMTSSKDYNDITDVELKMNFLHVWNKSWNTVRGRNRWGKWNFELLWCYQKVLE